MKRPAAKLALALSAAALTLGLTGASAVTTTQYTSGPMTAAIPEDGTSLLTPAISVPSTAGPVADVDLWVRAAHASVGDLVITLKHGDTSVVVFQNRGGTGDDLGTSPDDCGGVFTIFDDADTNPQIGLASAPFTGRYRPDNALSAFNGKDAGGDWFLEVKDTAGNTITGTLFCWKLDITITESDLVTELTDAPDPVTAGGEVTYTAKVTNKGPDTATDVQVELTLPAGGTVVTAPDGCTGTGTGPVTCNIGDIAKDGSASKDVKVKLDTAGQATASASASSGSKELVPSDNVASTTTAVDGPAGGGGSETIVVTLQGGGQGTVTSEPAGIDCGTDCIGGFAPGTEVTLTATPADGSVFKQWGGACGNSIGTTCIVTAGGELSVSATFELADTGGGGGGGSGGGGVYDICTIVGTAKADVLRGTNKKDVICGLAGNDKIYGLGGADRLYGNAGKDKLYGGSGNDLFFTKDSWKDTATGGSGRDRAKADGKDVLKQIEGVV
jgi:uncharacterized repeat protein (TIGR01451 family)